MCQLYVDIGNSSDLRSGFKKDSIATASNGFVHSTDYPSSQRPTPTPNARRLPAFRFSESVVILNRVRET
jgi:hypothetical protein